MGHGCTLRSKHDSPNFQSTESELQSPSTGTDYPNPPQHRNLNSFLSIQNKNVFSPAIGHWDKGKRDSMGKSYWLPGCLCKQESNLAQLQCCNFVSPHPSLNKQAACDPHMETKPQYKNAKLKSIGIKKRTSRCSCGMTYVQMKKTDDC